MGGRKKQKQITEILRKHKLWLLGEERGKRADLSGTNLYGVDLHEADLRGAGLYRANLCKADLRGADLYKANLRGANLCESNLCGANLCEANLYGANLYGSNLCEANLYRVKLDGTTSFYPLQCPEKGAYIGYKKADDKIVELEIPADALRSSATSRKCRASKAKVVSITNIEGNKAYEEARSNHDRTFVYRVGEIIEVKDYNTDRWEECAAGIHHFITREEAVKY